MRVGGNEGGAVCNIHSPSTAPKIKKELKKESTNGWWERKRTKSSINGFCLIWGLFIKTFHLLLSSLPLLQLQRAVMYVGRARFKCEGRNRGTIGIERKWWSAVRFSSIRASGGEHQPTPSAPSRPETRCLSRRMYVDDEIVSWHFLSYRHHGLQGQGVTTCIFFHKLWPQHPRLLFSSRSETLITDNRYFISCLQ